MKIKMSSKDNRSFFSPNIPNKSTEQHPVEQDREESASLRKRRAVSKDIKLSRMEEELLPLAFQEFLDYTNVIDVANYNIKKNRPYSYEKYMKDISYIEKMAHRIYTNFYLKIKCRKLKPLKYLKPLEFCPENVKNRFMKVPPKTFLETLKTSSAAPTASTSAASTEKIQNEDSDNFSYPVSFQLFKSRTYYKKAVEEFFKAATNNSPDAFKDFKRNKILQENVLHKFYEAFYKTPEIRKQFKIKIKPCPSSTKKLLLKIPEKSNNKGENNGNVLISPLVLDKISSSVTRMLENPDDSESTKTKEKINNHQTTSETRTSTAKSPSTKNTFYNVVAPTTTNTKNNFTECRSNHDGDNFSYPISFELFKTCTCHMEAVENFFKATNTSSEDFEEFQRNEMLQKTTVQKFYEAFYKTPEIRQQFQIEIKPCPASIAELLLKIPEKPINDKESQLVALAEGDKKSASVKRSSYNLENKESLTNEKEKINENCHFPRLIGSCPRSNMNSYMRRAPISADQMHNFLKDKQAWENAIAMYQGPDPMDHWYNYICWYENNGHGDPENKYRETLERCLTLYEHSEYYKQDIRIIRLWVKYIDMQPNPLHFYQILYQRGVGRQCACFYINWARCYESNSAFKEAESVFNLAFQEKAQPYAELQNAHSKLLYLRTSAAAVTLAQMEKPPAHDATVQPKLQQQFHYQQQHIQMTHQEHLQEQHAYQQLSYQQQLPSAETPQHVDYQQHVPQTEQQLQYAQHYAPEQQLNSATNAANPPNYGYTEDAGAATSTETVSSQCFVEEELNACVSQQRLTANKAIEIAPGPHQIAVEGVRLPRKFASYSRNNFEAWKPALFLEEPVDPNRRCHYAKQLVYPGNNTEYSLEEIRAERWSSAQRQNVKKQHENQTHFAAVAENKPTNREEPETEKINSVAHIYPQYHQHTFIEQQSANQYVAALEEEDDNATCDEYEKASNGDEPSTVVADATVVHTMDDLEDQIEASTIRFSTHTAQGVTKNKTIKIKFKKESRRSDDSHNGSNYSAYTIDNSSYKQQPAESCASPAPYNNNTPRSNGHSFHPYSMMGQTSTPKTSSKRTKNKLKMANRVHAIPACNNSNSSSADYVSNGRGGTVFLDATNENSIHNATFNDNANFSFSSAAALENSNSSVTSAVARLNFRDTSATNAAVDILTYHENSYFATQHDAEAKELRLRRAHETIERHLAKEAIDPFNSELCRAFLTKLDFPGTEDSSGANYKIIQTPLPKMQNTRTISLPDGLHFSVDKEVGRGSYGSVYKATDTNTGAVVALKYQKPPNTWEIYVCDQVLKRITSAQVLPGLMDISTAVIAPNASIIATEFSPFGSLLDINNKVRQATTKVMHESLVMHFSAQICNIIQHLHENKIIHADIKPDNFLLMRVPSTELFYPSLRLIDFGCAIDMTLFPDNTKFRKIIQTDGFTCVEMQEGRPWSYETDLFCIAGTVHVMLFGEYMQLQKRGGAWDIKQKLPRYLKKHVWTQFFGGMLNVQCDSELPDLGAMRATFDEEAAKMDSELQNQIRTLSNILYRR